MQPKHGTQKHDSSLRLQQRGPHFQRLQTPQQLLITSMPMVASPREREIEEGRHCLAVAVSKSRPEQMPSDQVEPAAVTTRRHRSMSDNQAASLMVQGFLGAGNNGCGQ